MNAIYRTGIEVGVEFSAPFNVTFGWQQARQEFSVWHHAEDVGDARYTILGTGHGYRRPFDLVATVVMPDGHDADRFRQIVLDRYNMSLGSGLGRLKGKAFRIGHLGDFNELMLIGTLGGVELGLGAAGVPFAPGGIAAAMASLSAAGEPVAAALSGR